MFQLKPFKNDKKCFLFHFKSSFCSQDTYIFVLTFSSCGENSLIGKMRLISNFRRHTLVNNNYLAYIAQYLRSKGNHTMKFGQEQNITRGFFLEKSCRKCDRQTISGPPFLFFNKAFLEVRASGLQLSFSIFRQSSTWHAIKKTD